MPLAALTGMQIAARRSTNASLRLAKIVPEVTEHWCAQALHRNLRRVVILQLSQHPPSGQTGSPPAQRISQNFAYAASSSSVQMERRLKVRAPAVRRKCWAVMHYFRYLFHP